MSKEREKVKLKTVDEESEKKESHVVRLRENTVEEVRDELPVRVGTKTVREARLEAGGRDELKTRSNEPDVGSLIEAPEARPEELWESAGPSKKLPFGWVILIVGIFAAGIIWSLTQLGRAEKRHETLEAEAEVVLEKEMEDSAAAERMVRTIENVTRDFHNSRSIEELLRHVGTPERVKPLMEDYYGRHPLEPSGFERVTTLDPLTVERSGRFWIVGAEFDSEASERLLVEVENPETAKVDWETFVCYQPMEWDEFVRSRPEGYSGDFRVYVQPDHFYAHEFSDSEKYMSLNLSTLGSEEYLFGYLPRKSEFGERMAKLIYKNNGASTPMVLRLRVPENAISKRGVLIEELMAERWLFVDSPEGSE